MNTRTGMTARLLLGICGLMLSAMAMAVEVPASSGQSLSIKDLITSLATLIGVPAAMLAATKAINEFHRGNQERIRENRHKQASAAKGQLDALFSDPLARAAMQMLDWSGREYNTGSQTQAIFFRELKPALRLVDLTLDEKEAYIRDCFEKLFDHLSMIEHLCKIEYLNFDDVAVPIAYYARKIAGHPDAYFPFIDTYGYSLAKDFIQRAVRPEKTSALGAT